MQFACGLRFTSLLSARVRVQYFFLCVHQLHLPSVQVYARRHPDITCVFVNIHIYSVYIYTYALYCWKGSGVCVPNKNDAALFCIIEYRRSWRHCRTGIQDVLLVCSCQMLFRWIGGAADSETTAPAVWKVQVTTSWQNFLCTFRSGFFGTCWPTRRYNNLVNMYNIQYGI